MKKFLQITAKIAAKKLELQPLEKAQLEAAKSMPIDLSQFSRRQQIIFEKVGIKTVYDLMTRSENQMLNYRNFGHRGLTEVRDYLKKFGIEQAKI